jgi:hypothetical protein
VHPNAHKSFPKVAGAEFRTSGGTYAAVPTNVQALSLVEFGRTLIGVSLVGLTLPKSAILMCPSEVSSKFSG